MHQLIGSNVSGFVRLEAERGVIDKNLWKTRICNFLHSLRKSKEKKYVHGRCQRVVKDTNWILNLFQKWFKNAKIL